MKQPKKNNLREDVEKCLTDPVYDIVKNFSLEKSKEFYSKWEEAWNSWTYTNNPAVKKEKEEFEYKTLDELEKISREAKMFFYNMRDMPVYYKNVGWEMKYDKIIVHWVRFKTFDEWLHDGLKDALIQASDCPEDGARQIIERELGKGIYSNTAIHMFAEWKIDADTLKRLGTYEKYMHMDDRDIEEDIEQARKALEDLEENNKGSVTVLTLKM